MKITVQLSDEDEKFLDILNKTPQDIFKTGLKNEVLGLFGTETVQSSPASQATAFSSNNSDVNKIGWSKGGVFLEDGTIFRGSYSGYHMQGKIVGSRWVINGQEFKSPSKAAMEAAGQHLGRDVTALNGWQIWEIKRPNDNGFVRLEALRAGKPSRQKRQ